MSTSLVITGEFVVQDVCIPTWCPYAQWQGYNGKEACYRVAPGLLWSFCYALLYHANSFLAPFFLSLLLIFHYCPLLCLSFAYFLPLLLLLLSSLLPPLSVCLILLLELCSGAWWDGCGNIKVLVMILASLQRCSEMKVQGVWVSSVCTCHGRAAIIGPKVPLPLHGGGGNSCECVRLFITSCGRLNSRFSAQRSRILWMWPRGAKQRNFNTPNSQYYSTPECRAFQTIREELWKARRRVIYRVRLAWALALALAAGRDISHSHSKGDVMPLAEGRSKCS